MFKYHASADLGVRADALCARSPFTAPSKVAEANKRDEGARHVAVEFQLDKTLG